MFLGAGSVMHAMNDDVNMRHYGAPGEGACRHVLDVRRWATWRSSGSRCFAGYFSKDHIIEAAFEHSPIVGTLRADRCRHHRLLHDPADADDLPRREALAGRASTRTSRRRSMTSRLIMLVRSRVVSAAR